MQVKSRLYVEVTSFSFLPLVEAVSFTLTPMAQNFLYQNLVFPNVNLNTCYNNPTTFSLTTTSYLDCLQKCKPNDEDLSSINVDKCALKPNASVTQKIKK